MQLSLGRTPSAWTECRTCSAGSCIQVSSTFILAISCNTACKVLLAPRRHTINFAVVLRACSFSHEAALGISGFKVRPCSALCSALQADEQPPPHASREYSCTLLMRLLCDTVGPWLCNRQDSAERPGLVRSSHVQDVRRRHWTECRCNIRYVANSMLHVRFDLRSTCVGARACYMCTGCRW